MTHVQGKLVFAARQPPFPATYGTGIRTHRLLTGLAQRFDTTFVTFEHHPSTYEGEYGPAEVARLLPGIDVVGVPGPPPHKRASQIRSLSSPRSWQFGRFRSRAFARALAEVADTAAIVHLDDLAVGQFGPFDAALTAYAPHNVEHRIIQGTADASRGPRRAFAAIEWRKVKREEERVWRRMPLCVAVSGVDAATFRAAGAPHVEVCPNGVDPVEPLAWPRRAHHEPLRILFVGTGLYQPNERGLSWFVREVLPRVRAAVPACLDVIGSPPRRPAHAEGVVYHGRVAALKEWYERAHVAVVPVFYGSGTRLKVIEAMAYGRPVVSTPLGCEGLPVEPGRHYLEAGDADGFARALVELAHGLTRGDPGVERLLRDARQAVSGMFWPDVVARLADLYADRSGKHPALMPL